MIPDKLMEIIVCPTTKEDLVYTDQGLCTKDKKFKYPIIDDTPILIPESI